MTDKQPEALRLADALEASQPNVYLGVVPTATQLLRTQHAAIERKDALLMRALLLCDWLAETPHQRGSINGLAAQLQHAITSEIEQ